MLMPATVCVLAFFGMELMDTVASFHRCATVRRHRLIRFEGGSHNDIGRSAVCYM